MSTPTTQLAKQKNYDYTVGIYCALKQMIIEKN